MSEPATALTDYLLALVALVLLLRLARAGARKDYIGAPMFFFGVAAAAVFGGTWHGFFSDGASAANRVVWWLSLAFTGVTAAGLAVVGLERFGWRGSRASWVGSAMFVAAFAGYAWWDPRFLIAVIATGAAALVCLAGLLHDARRHERSGAGIAAAGLVLAVFAGVLQQRGVAIHPVHFDHNATYHLWLLPALILFYMGNRQSACSGR